MHKPILQVALDLTEEKRALQIAEEAVAGGADWIEAGTPLIKSEGMHVVRSLRAKFPKINRCRPENL
jgi:3-hexulose-6-phosphate synthase and related proteins